MKNIDKWNYYKEILKEKEIQYINFIKHSISIPDEFYQVNNYGGYLTTYKVKELKYKFDFPTYFYGKAPKKEDVNNLKNNIENELHFIKENILLECETSHNTKVSLLLTNVRNNPTIFFNLEEAVQKSFELKELTEKNNKIKESIINKTFNFSEYKFLGWANSWNNENKPKELIECEHNGHKRISVSMNKRGIENIVVCTTCKIYYKYDCSD